MSKLRDYFNGYRKHCLSWLAFFVVIGVVNICNSGSTNAQTVSSADLYSLLANIVITAPILAFITLSIRNGHRRLSGSKNNDTKRRFIP